MRKVFFNDLTHSSWWVFFQEKGSSR